MNLKTDKYWDKAWQLVDGCTPVSAGCDNCWSAGMTHRFKQGLTDAAGKFCGDIIIRESRLDLPLKTKKPTVWSVWNDLFHPSVPADFITAAFDIMQVCHGKPTLVAPGKLNGYETYSKHTFLILTKRPERIHPVLFGDEGRYYLGGGDYMENVWLGTSIENQKQADKRIPELIKGAGEFKKFLSIEPMLEEIDLRTYLASAIGEHYPYRPAFDQIICGGETGRNARPCHPDWVRSIRNQCQAAGVPFFFKGWGEWVDSEFPEMKQYPSFLPFKLYIIGADCLYKIGHKATGRTLDGRTHDDLVWRGKKQ